jgi:hypothetical protein
LADHGKRGMVSPREHHDVDRQKAKL